MVDALPVDPQDPAQVRVFAGLILEEAARNDDFAGALERWTTVIQADTVNGGIGFGDSPLPADRDAQ
ncbi:hypothetical protein QQM39_44185 [Streptomyces sp. DT2A-34]|uniref:hypothetical protein n=1 Tax=Streptomyces sp. DT2A-34 TaxID=3051182 RepID=UPI00265B84B7|nr:hypothetical protein [Streptomyces sp. DT2A-34]MDO0917543.1 hypothetical protein [Streptomyces sp. DT2A-34]